MLFFGFISPIKEEAEIFQEEDILEPLTIERGEVLKINPQVSILVTSTIKNYGIIENQGTLTVVGTINNQMSSAIKNNLGGTLETIDQGTINVFIGSMVTNSGTFSNRAITNIYAGGTVINNEEGVLSNEGSLTNWGGVFVNLGTFENKFEAVLTNNGDTIINKGSIINNGKITNEKSFSNNDEGTFTNTQLGLFTNNGYFSNFGVIINEAGIMKTDRGTIMNEGLIYNCDGVIEGISRVKFNTVLFDCETIRSNQIDEKYDLDSAITELKKSSSKSSNTSDEQQIDTSSQEICGPGMVLKNAICIEEEDDPAQVKKRIPDWIKNIAVQWANGNIGNADFIDLLRSLIYDNVIDISESTSAMIAGGGFVPQWFSHTTGWWSEGLISEDEFINALTFLIKKEIIRI